MNEAGSKFRISIRTRILGMVLLLIAAVFLVILTVFNLLVQEYIKSSVNTQLEEAVKAMDVSYPRYISPGVQSPLVPGTEFIPDLRRLPRGPLGKAEAFIISANYELIFPDSNMVFMRNYEEINALVTQLKTERINLQSEEK